MFTVMDTQHLPCTTAGYRTIDIAYHTKIHLLFRLIGALNAQKHLLLWTVTARVKQDIKVVACKKFKKTWQ